MTLVALKMLVGDRAKFAGIVLGLAFAALLITQQGAIFVGIVHRTYGVIADASCAQIWVMDPRVEVIDDPVPLPDSAIDRVRGIEGVASASPFYRGFATARLSDGSSQDCAVCGIDDESLLGGPPLMRRGRLSDLRLDDGVIIDEFGARDKLAITGSDGRRRGMAIGDAFEINERHAVVVGICAVTRSFQSRPVVFTTYPRSRAWSPPERRHLSFVLVTARAGVELDALCDRIRRRTGLAACTTDSFERQSAAYVVSKTGILINFAIGIGLGILVGTAIAGQAFYNFTLENRRHFAALKAMGVRRIELVGMILVQALVVGFIGFGCGVGAAALFGWLARGSELAFVLPWQLLAISLAAVLLICAGTSLASLARVLRLQPAAVFRA